MTRETALPKPKPKPLDWKRIAKSGKVWDFVEGEDFKGKPETFRARLKTAARKEGVDFESTPVEVKGKTVLKVLAFEVDGKPGENAAATASGGEPNGESASAKPERDRDGNKRQEQEPQYA